MMDERARIGLPVPRNIPVYELAGMNYPESLTPEDAMAFTAVQLFVDSARRSRPNFVLTAENVGHVVQVCRLVQGMPLGLVLAAAWLEILTTGEIAAEVEDCIYFLAVELTDLPPRQRSVAAVFDRSWHMMEPEEQAVLIRLSVFRGGFTREAAEAVADANLRLLLSLVNKSLIRRQPENGRFVIHELLRQFAAMKEGQQSNLEDAKLAHCHYFARLLDKETALAASMYPLHIPTKYLTDKENIRQSWIYAVNHALAEELSDMVRGIAMTSFMEGQRPTAILEQAIWSLEQQGIPKINDALLDIRLVELNTRLEFVDYIRLKNDFLEFITFLESHDNPKLLYWAYDGMAFLEVDHDMKKALEWHEKAYHVAARLKDELFIRRIQALSLWFLVDSDFHPEDILPQLKEFGSEPRKAQLEKLAAYFEARFSNSFVLYGILMSLCIHNFRTGSSNEARSFGIRALNIAKGWRDLYWIAFASDRMALINLDAGLMGEAKSHILDTLEWHLAIGQVWQTLGYFWSTAAKFHHLLREETALSILGMVYIHPEATDFYRQEIDKARPSFEAKMDNASFLAAWESGKDMGFETAVSMIQAALGAN
jgi:hypothetical protein